MTCTTAVFTLMFGATVLSSVAIYSHFKNQMDALKQKLSALNTALIELQGERGNLIHKTENMYLENAIQSSELERLKSEILTSRDTIERLEKDNRHLIKEYVILEKNIKSE